MNAAQAENAKPRLLRADTLASSIVLLLAVNVVQRSIGFGRGVLFCRWLEPEALGRWEMAYTFLLLAAPVAALGLPGSFGRYLARYRERGELRLFLRRTAAWTLSLGGSAIGLIVLGRAELAQLVFRDAEQSTLIVLMAGCLAAVMLHHFLQAVFAGLKCFRVVSAMNFCQSVVYAATALTLIAFWRADAASIVLGYGVGCLVGSTGVLLWAVLGRVTDGETARADGSTTHREFWPPLLQFAVGVWVADLLSNLFTIIDRYMILHSGVFEAAAARELIGNYHTSCIVPVLMISVANLLVGAITPHLSHDWERGDRQRVSDRLNQILQRLALGMLAAGVAVLLFCPWLFRIAFDEKYADGLAVLPWSVAACVWFALLMVAQTYVWCAERTRTAALSLAAGLVVNVGLNLVWLPLWGLPGAVAATAVATLITVYLQLAVNERLGMRLAPATLACCLCPLLLAGGAVVASVGAIAVAAAIGVGWVLNRPLQHPLAANS